MFDGEQLARLLGSDRPLSWLTEEVTEARAADLREYLMNDLDVAEIRIEDLLPRLDESFLEDQPPEWIRRLYELLHDLPSLLERAKSLPLIRLSGKPRQVHPEADGLPAAFLPGPTNTGFPTVHPEVCCTDTSRRFLEALGLSRPDPVDDVLRYILPKYRDKAITDDSTYVVDFVRILNAFEFAEDSTTRRKRLVDALRTAYIVAARDAQTGERTFLRPNAVYPNTQRLISLFAGVAGVSFVDDAYEVLRREEARDLLEDCGVGRYLRTCETPYIRGQEELRKFRQKHGLEAATWGREGPKIDRTLLGLDLLLEHLVHLTPVERTERAGVLWDALAELARRNRAAFQVPYEWGYSHQSKRHPLDAASIEILRTTAWVPDADGELRVPKEIAFESTGWQDEPFLQSKIEFRPPALDQLAKEVGIETGVLHLLDRYGIRTEEDLVARLDLARETDGEESDEPNNGRTVTPEGSTWNSSRTETVETSVSGAGEYRGGPGTPRSNSDSGRDRRPDGGGGRDSGAAAGRRSPGPGGGARPRRFISYVAVDATEEDAGESDGLDQGERMALEARAIALILEREPAWLRTPPGNRGFDLVQTEDGTPSGRPTRWCEVKAIRASLDEYPVGLSKAQFEFAAKLGDAAWLYVVERADGEDVCILRIQDPAGRAKTFTFDEGWRKVAQVEPPD